MLIEYINNKAKVLSQVNVLTNTYGFARSLMAFGLLITFLFNNTNILFSTDPDHYAHLSDVPLSKISFFLLLVHHLQIARIITILILLIVVSGWRPRITGILHWYVTFSFYISSDYYDGGDQIAAILCLLLIPFCLFDKRKWAWIKLENSTVSEYQKFVNIFLNVVYFVIRLQVCIIYLDAGIEKMKVNEWVDGTATYYWFTNAGFGAADWIKPLIVFLFSKPLIVVFFTWGTMIFEIILGMAIMMKRNNTNWKILLSMGILFHFGIIVFHGLISFFFSMFAALILYLYPLNKYIPLKEKPFNQKKRINAVNI
jgi:antimicrobial peptide system SdpB family protein